MIKKDYIYDYKPIETLAALKYPDSVYVNLYTGLKSHLNWEKQFKCLDNLRKVVHYHAEILKNDHYYFSLLFDEAINLVSSIRSSLARNALVTLSEIFEAAPVNLSQKYEITLKILLKKLQDKNDFIVQESRKCLNA